MTFRLTATRKMNLADLVPRFFVHIYEGHWNEYPRMHYRSNTMSRDFSASHSSFLHKQHGRYVLNPGGWWNAIAGQSIEMAAIAAKNVANAVVRDFPLEK